MLVELCATCTEADELMEGDVQDLRFRFLSDSILTTAEVEQGEKPQVHAVQEQASEAAPVLEQEVDTNVLVGQNLVELRIEKMTPSKRKSKFNVLPDNFLFKMNLFQNEH